MQPNEVTAQVLIDALRLVTTLPVQVQQTGGGCATLYVGVAREIDGDHRYQLAIGPGTFNWTEPMRSTFQCGDLYVGPDDYGVLDAYTVTSAPQLARLVRYMLAAPDWRDSPTDYTGFTRTLLGAARDDPMVDGEPRSQRGKEEPTRRDPLSVLLDAMPDVEVTAEPNEPPDPVVQKLNEWADQLIDVYGPDDECSTEIAEGLRGLADTLDASVIDGTLAAVHALRMGLGDEGLLDRVREAARRGLTPELVCGLCDDASATLLHTFRDNDRMLVLCSRHLHLVRDSNINDGTLTIPDEKRAHLSLAWTLPDVEDRHRYDERRP